LAASTTGAFASAALSFCKVRAEPVKVTWSAAGATCALAAGVLGCVFSATGLLLPEPWTGVSASDVL
jgi:hypothetical protein